MNSSVRAIRSFGFAGNRSSRLIFRGLLLATILLALGLISIYVNRAGAAGGDLDATFNPGGAGTSAVDAVALQPDGKILIGGGFTTYNGDAAASDRIMRLNPDGTPDATFNPGGIGADAVVSAIALQPDGKIIIGGSFTTYNGDAAASDRIMRLNSDGTRDATFNPGGAGATDGVLTVTMQPDGKIIIGGNLPSYNGDVSRGCIRRLNSDGTTDPTFNSGGSGASSTVIATALQPDGKIIMGGAFIRYNGDAAASDFVMRLNSDGTRDATFNSGGSGADHFARAVKVQADGKIVIGGTFTSYNGDATASDRVMRLNSDGTRDTTFNSGGLGADSAVSDVSLQSDGQILIGGAFTLYNGDAAASDRVMRLNSDGTRDVTFNASGAGVDSEVRKIALQPDGKIIVAGVFTSYNGIAAASDGIIRLQPAPGALTFSTAVYEVIEPAGTATITLKRTGGTDNQVVSKVTLSDVTTSPADYRFTPGALDTTFNVGTGADGGIIPVRTTAVQPDGKIIIGGDFTTYNGTSRPRIARLNTDGTLDTTFDPGTGASSTVHTTFVQSDGKIIIGGLFATYNGTSRPHMARLKADGTLDTAFDPGTGASTNVLTSALQSDGKIIIGGFFTSYNGTSRNNIARLKADGTLDTSFDPGTGASATVFTTAVQADGKIIIGGAFNTYNGTGSPRLARLNTDGTLDTTFNVGTGASSNVRTTVVQSDGKIIIGGDFTTYNSVARNRIARLNTDGTLDTTFNPGTGPGPGTSVLTSAVQADGKIIIGGSFTTYNGTSHNHIARLNGDGTLDTSFNPGTGASSNVETISVQADGKIIIGGGFTSYNGVARNCIARVGGDLFVTWAAGDATDKIIQLPIVNDGVAEGDETLNLALAVMSGGATLGSPSSATLTIHDPTALSINDVSTTEGNSGTKILSFTVTRSGGSNQTVTVNCATTDGTATAGSDYATVRATLTFNPGDLTKSVDVPINSDQVFEANETLFVNLVSPVNATISDSQGQGTITNDDAPPALSINDVSTTEGDSGTKILSFTVTLAGASSQTATVNYATANGIAIAGSDYVATSATLTFNPGDLTKSFDVTINGDQSFEANETFVVNLSGATNATITDNQGVGTITNDDAEGGIISFSQSEFSVTEAAGSVTINVNRTGDTTRAATVNYETDDTGSPGPCGTFNSFASSKCDFTTAFGTLTFAANETQKTFVVLVNHDSYASENPFDAFNVKLTNLTGGAGPGTNSTATVKILESGALNGNASDDPRFFVRQHYHDFLNREPDQSGWDFWTNQIASCGSDAQCTEVRRLDVSASFFLSIEFQQIGYLVERFYKVAYGDATGSSTFGPTHQLPVPMVRFNEFLRDTQRIGQGVVVLAPGWEQLLEANKQAYALDFVQTSRFTAANAFPTTLTPAEFVDKLNQNAGNVLSPSERTTAINLFGGAANTDNTPARAQAIRQVAEDLDLYNAEYTRAFVLVQYFGYLRRNPNDAPDPDHTGYDFWLTKLNQFNGNYSNAEMVKAFLSSIEYRQRFGQ